MHYDMEGKEKKRKDMSLEDMAKCFKDGKLLPKCLLIIKEHEEEMDEEEE